MQLTNKEILEKAIQKAIDGGWRPFYVHGNVKDYKTTILSQYEVGDYSFSKGNYCCDFEGLLTAEYIFNHDFAKALWGEEKYMAYFAGYNEWSDATDIEYVEDQDYDEEPHEKKPIWQYHLQQMVISENPIQYLGEHLDG